MAEQQAARRESKSSWQFNLNLEIGAHPQAACGSSLTLGKMDQPMNSFRRAYLISLVVLGFFAIGGGISSLSGHGAGIGYGVAILAIFVTALFPTVRKGGIPCRPRLAFGISSGLTILFGILLLCGFWEFVRTGGSEGPNGEGAPLAGIIAMTLFAFLFFCPWLLTTIRGRTAIRRDFQAQQDAAPNRSLTPVPKSEIPVRGSEG